MSNGHEIEKTRASEVDVANQIGRPVSRTASLLSARDDVSAVQGWLARYIASPHTIISYEKEVERFLLWLNHQRLSLGEVKVEDAEAFRRVLHQPPASWIGPKRPRTHPEWKPFTGPLSPKSVQVSISVIKSLYQYLSNARYLQGNPFALLKPEPVQKAPFERFIEAPLWDRLFSFICDMHQGTQREKLHAVRCRWLFAVLYLTGARRQEIAQATHGDFILRDGRWWLRVTGKGNKTDDIPVPNALLDEWRRYRLSIGLSEWPDPGDKTPLIGRIRMEPGVEGGHETMTAQAIHLIVKAVFSQFADYLQQQGEGYLAGHVKGMSAHWLRHTAASHQLDAGIPLLAVSQNLRHSKLETTRRYLHTEKDARHDATREFGITKK